MKGAAIVVKSLEDLGVKHVFGYTGAAILPIIDELTQSSLEIIVNSNEQSAAFSAAGYSRASDRVGIAMVTSGPAITNTLTAVADSFADRIPLLVIAGQAPEYSISSGCWRRRSGRYCIWAGDSIARLGAQRSAGSTPCSKSRR